MRYRPENKERIIRNCMLHHLIGAREYRVQFQFKEVYAQQYYGMSAADAARRQRLEDRRNFRRLIKRHPKIAKRNGWTWDSVNQRLRREGN